MAVDELTRAIAGLVAVVSLAMIGIGVRLLPQCWYRFQHYLRQLSLPVRKSAFPLLALAHLPFVWAVIFACLSVKLPNYMPGIFLLIVAGTALLVFLISIGVAIKRKIKKQTVVKIKIGSYAVAYTTALSYMALSVFLNLVALIGVAPSMLLIDIGPVRPENFEWGKWFLYIAIFTFIVGISMFGLTLAFDKASHKNDSG